MNVDDLFINTKEAVEKATSQLRNKQIWVINPHVCDKCGAECDAETQFVGPMAAIEPVWQCPNDDCRQRYYRDKQWFDR